MAASRNLLAGCCAAALLWSAGASAQSAGEGIETIVVTAQKRTEDVQSVPITVQGRPTSRSSRGSQSKWPSTRPTRF